MAVPPPTPNMEKPLTIRPGGPTGTVRKLKPMRPTPNMEKMPTWGGGATGAKKIGGPMIRKTPPIYNNPQQAKKMTNLRQKMISGNRLKAAASKRIALGGLRKKMAASGKVSDWGGGSKGLKRTLPSIKQKADWAKAVRDNPKGINFAALRKNDKTWKGPK